MDIDNKDPDTINWSPKEAGRVWYNATEASWKYWDGKSIKRIIVACTNCGKEIKEDASYIPYVVGNHFCSLECEIAYEL